MKLIGTAVFVLGFTVIPWIFVGLGWSVGTSILMGVIWMTGGYSIADGELYSPKWAERLFNRIRGFLVSLAENATRNNR